MAHCSCCVLFCKIKIRQRSYQSYPLRRGAPEKATTHPWLLWPLSSMVNTKAKAYVILFVLINASIWCSFGKNWLGIKWGWLLIKTDIVQKNSDSSGLLWHHKHHLDPNHFFPNLHQVIAFIAIIKILYDLSSVSTCENLNTGLQCRFE